MEHKIGWCQNEFICKAYETWNNIIMNAQIKQPAASSSMIIQHQSSSLNKVNLMDDSNEDEKQQTQQQQRRQQNSISLCSTQQLFKQQTSLNKASVSNFLNLNEISFLQDPLSTPWKPVDFKYDSAYEALHKEILLFKNYISPTNEERYMREEIIQRIEKIILSELPTAKVDIFGSYVTGLFLPTSDIDMVVIGDWKSLPLFNLKEAILRDKLSSDDNIKVLDKASVPIIKIVECKTELKIDISFNTLNGVKSAYMIKDYLQKFPQLAPLVMVLKQYLLQYDFNEVWTGGIGSYSLILMVVNFLQLHPRVPLAENENLGVLLIEFFEFYGRYYNYLRTAIRVRDGGSYVVKEDIRKQFPNSNVSVLCIEDPLNSSNDIGKASYHALKVRSAFDYAFQILNYAVLPQNKFLLKHNPSILGRILRITKDTIEYRRKIKNLYRERLQEHQQVEEEEEDNDNNNNSSSSNNLVEFYIGSDNNSNVFNNDNDINNNVNKSLLSLFSCNSINFFISKADYCYKI